MRLEGARCGCFWGARGFLPRACCLGGKKWHSGAHATTTWGAPRHCGGTLGRGVTGPSRAPEAPLEAVLHGYTCIYQDSYMYIHGAGGSRPLTTVVTRAASPPRDTVSNGFFRGVFTAPGGPPGAPLAGGAPALRLPLGAHPQTTAHSQPPRARRPRQCAAHTSQDPCPFSIGVMRAFRGEWCKCM